jgi:2'-5' RNA ligase
VGDIAPTKGKAAMAEIREISAKEFSITLDGVEYYTNLASIPLAVGRLDPNGQPVTIPAVGDEWLRVMRALAKHLFDEAKATRAAAERVAAQSRRLPDAGA